MAKRTKHVRMFLLVAKHRLDDAQFLRGQQRSVAAAYLGGYVVECLLKALILSCLEEFEQLKMVKRFRGAHAHDFEWLRKQYSHLGGTRLPNPVTDSFVILEAWGTVLRYNPRVTFDGDIDEFFSAVLTVRDWATARIH